MAANRVRKCNTDDKEDPKECTSVLWEKRFQQTIFVDISDDDSLHFSHLQSSFTMCVSHDLAASSENSGLSGSSKAVGDSFKSPPSISSQYRHYGNIRDVQGNEMNVSTSQPDRQAKQTRWTHEDDNTSDDDQEELPYDGLDEEKRNRNWSSVSEQKSLTEGYRLTIELKDIINQFTAQVEEFKMCLNNMSMSVEEQQMVFKSMMEAQDQLEQNYMTKKEEHRALEMQNCMGLKWNTGTFDHDRLLEGEIFQLGMHLEDIKEQIDRNAYFVLSPSPTSTTPSPLPHGEYIPSSSVQPALQKESVFGFSSKSRLMDKEEESYKNSYEVPGAVDSSPSCSRENNLSIYNKMSCIPREDAKGSAKVSEEEDNYMDIQTQLSNPLSPQHQSMPSRCVDKDCYSAEDWISCDTEHSKRTGADCGSSDDKKVPGVFILTHRRPTNKTSHVLSNSFPVSLENLSLDTSQSTQGNNYWRADVATTFTGLNTIGNNASFGLPNHSRKNRNIEYMKPSYKLPSGFKVQDQQSEPGVTKMRCSSQSDSALLPSIFYFYKASTLPTYPSRTGCAVHRVKEEALNQTIDETLDAALLMKQITDHMAKTLSSDLAMAQLYRKLREMA